VSRKQRGVRMSVLQREPVENAQQGRRVLVVDDHESFRRCASELLSSEGYQVVGEAPDGATALALAATLRPELVLLDIQLPDIDGFAVSEALLAANPELKIVLVSSRDRSTYGPRIETSGAAGFIAKADLSVAELERLIE
jgi:DNA-binding NarL/FixJ family response regulator